METQQADDVHRNNVIERFEAIGHVPASFTGVLRLVTRSSPRTRTSAWVRLRKFLKRPTNCGEARIKGKRVHGGGGYGLEVPCEYLFEGDNFSSG